MRLKKVDLKKARQELTNPVQKISVPNWMIKARDAIIKAIDWIDNNLSTDGEYIKLPPWFKFKKWKTICDLLFTIIRDITK